MKELFEKLEETNNEIANNIEQLGWFLYEVSNREGDHSEAIHALIALNPEFPKAREILFHDVLRILDIDEVAFHPANSSGEPITASAAEDSTQIGEQIRDVETEPTWHARCTVKEQEKNDEKAVSHNRMVGRRGSGPEPDGLFPSYRGVRAQAARLSAACELPAG